MSEQAGQHQKNEPSDFDITSLAFIKAFNAIAIDINQTAKDKGWWDKPAEYHLLREFIDSNAMNKEQANDLLKVVDKLTERNDGEILACFTPRSLRRWRHCATTIHPITRFPGSMALRPSWQM